MSIFNIVHIEEMCRRGSIRETDVRVLQATLSQQQALDQSSIDDLFRIHTLCHLHAAAWADFFIETVTDYLVHERQPSGYLTLEQVRYLFDRLLRNGRLETKTEFDLILNLLDKSRWAPERLAASALEQVHVAVATGAGVLRGGQELASGEVTAQDISHVRTILNAFGGDECRPLTKGEAQVLCTIDECLTRSGEADAWSEFFTLAVANLMLAASGYRVPTREVALAPGPAGPNRRKIPGGSKDHLAKVFAGYSRVSPEERAIMRLERQRLEIVTGEQTDEADAIWLAERLNTRFGNAPHLAALLAFFRDQDIRLHPVLRNVMLRHVKAA